jgi:hypothetical protein
LLLQKTSLNCDRFVKASTRSWTRLFSSDKFRAMTGQDDKCKVQEPRTKYPQNWGSRRII